MYRNCTEIIFLLDRSGSMGGLESDTIGGFNAFIEKQRNLEGETLVTTVLFDDRYEILWNGVDAKDVLLTEKEYYVRGTTALLDAIGKTILDVGHRLARSRDEEGRRKVIFVITTDGLENASREFTREKIKYFIRHQQQKYDWEFIFLGANIDTVKEAGSLGIERHNAYNFEATEEGLKTMYCMVSEAVSERRKK